MRNQNQSKFSKGISTPIGILIIVVLASIVGGVVVWDYHKNIKSKEVMPTEKKVSEIGVSSPLAKKKIKVLSPSMGEIWKIGETYSVRWESSEKIESVRIELWNDAVGGGHIMKEIILKNNPGIYDLYLSPYEDIDITSIQEEWNDLFFIRIVDTNCGEFCADEEKYGKTEYFKIIKSSLSEIEEKLTITCAIEGPGYRGGQKGGQDKCVRFFLSLFEKGLPSEIASSSEKLKEYFQKNLSQVSEFRLQEIIRGKFDKYSKDEIVIIPFEYGVMGASALTDLIILREQKNKNYQVFFQHIERRIGKIFKSCHQNVIEETGIEIDFCKNYQDDQDESFYFSPLKLIKDEPEFLMAQGNFHGGTCTNSKKILTIYKFERNQLKPIWEFDYYELESGKPAKVTFLDLIKFQDLNKDGNLEIILNGLIFTCKEGCFDCKGVLSQEKIQKVFKWSFENKVFEEKK